MILIVLLVGGIVGWVNGFFVAKFQLHPFIVTLATQLIVYGLLVMYIMINGNNGQPLSGLDQHFNDVVRDRQKGRMSMDVKDTTYTGTLQISVCLLYTSIEEGVELLTLNAPVKINADAEGNVCGFVAQPQIINVPFESSTGLRIRFYRRCL